MIETVTQTAVLEASTRVAQGFAISLFMFVNVALVLLILASTSRRRWTP